MENKTAIHFLPILVLTPPEIWNQENKVLGSHQSYKKKKLQLQTTEVTQNI